jgi:hypothetical protein
MSCYSGSNNIHFNSPPLMSDGRNFSSWQPEAVVNQRIQTAENINSNWNYRKYLQQNAQQIMKYNSMESCYELGLDVHATADKMPSSNVPHLYKSVMDSGKPGFGYNTSDLKSPYLSREQLNARMISPSIQLSKK